MLNIILKITVLMILQVSIVQANNDYVSDFNDYYLSILKAADSDPQSALATLQEHKPTSDLEQAQHHYTYSIIYGDLDMPMKMLEHSESGLQIIKQKTEPWLGHFLNVTRIDALNRIDNAFSEIESLQHTVDWAKQSKHNTLAATALIQLSSLYLSVEDYSKAFSLIQQALELAPLEGEVINHADVNRELAAIYVHRNEFELALPFFSTSYLYNQSKNNILGMSIDLFEMGRAHLETNNVEIGVNELNQSIELALSIDDKQGIAYAQTELANHYLYQGDYELAKKLLLASSSQFKTAGNTYLLFDNLIQLSMLHVETGDFDLAQAYINEAEHMNQASNIRYGTISINKQRAALYAAQMKFQAAYELLLQTQFDEQQLASKLSSAKLHDLRIRYEVEANAIKNQLLAENNQIQASTIADQVQQRRLLIVFIVMLGIILMLSFLFNRNLKKQSERLHELANFDELTGLKNRSNVVKSIRKKLSRLAPNDDIAIVMIDLDHFKKINDTYGHALGDKVLSLFGQYCQELKMHTKWIGRLGGEEFIMAFIKDTNNKAQIYKIIDALRIKTNQMPNFITAPDLKVSISAGICHSKGKHKFREILKHADTAMYQAKHNGRNQIQTIELD